MFPQVCVSLELFLHLLQCLQCNLLFRARENPWSGTSSLRNWDRWLSALSIKNCVCEKTGDDAAGGITEATDFYFVWDLPTT